MNSRCRFTHAIQILAPDDKIIQQAAKNVPGHSRPAFPGTAALEFVATMQKAREFDFSAPAKKTTPSAAPKLSLSNALRIKTAECWLKLGEADEALQELERLPRKMWDHSLVLKARVAAMGILRERNQSSGSSMVR